MRDKSWRPIPGYNGYFINQKLSVRVRRQNRSGVFFRLLSRQGNRVLVNSVTGRSYVDVLELYGLAFKEARKQTIIKYDSGEGRIPLDRHRVYKHILRFMPDVQISITPNKMGVFETTPSMREKGMLVCDSCGHIQACEIILCKNCNQLITE